MPSAAGVRVWIEVDDIPLPEYRLSVYQQRSTCYIPSQEGKRFSVRFENLAGLRTGLRGNVYLDGIASGAGILLDTDAYVATISGQSRWEGFESPFQFARLKTTDNEDEACQDERRLRDLGTIRVQIEWVQVLRQEPFRAPSSSVSADQPIHERSKKASAHCTSLGELEISRPKCWYSTTRILGSEPMDFVFQYAPLDWLRAQDIVPSLIPSTSSSSSNSNGKRSHTAQDDSESDVTVSELLDKDEAVQYQRLKAKMAIRAKRRKVIKQEPVIASITSFRRSPEVIDLTGDE